MRALIDPASEVSIISHSMMQRLDLVGHKIERTLEAIGGNPVCKSNLVTELTVESTDDAHVSVKGQVLVVRQLGITIPSSVVNRHWAHVRGLNLADPTFSGNQGG